MLQLTRGFRVAPGLREFLRRHEGLKRLFGGRVLQAGEYRFEHAASALDVVDRIERGDIFYYTLVAPEGKNMFDLAQLAAQLGLFNADAFLTAARNPAMIRDLDPAVRSRGPLR